GVWRDNARRWDAQVPTWDVLRSHGAETRCLFVGDAAMSPYEITHPGGANEHWNREAGAVWLQRAAEHWPQHLWINPVPEAHWRLTHSTRLVNDLMGGRMVPMTLEGLTRGIRMLR
ncbi:MAG: VWA domain-containing protein, partial [Paracoccaceae bacterium]